MAKGFINRVLSLSSTNYREKNKHIIMDTLLKNDYPKTLINRLINSCKIYRSNTDSPSLSLSMLIETAEKKYRSILYVPGISEKIRKALARANNTIGIAFKCFKTLGNVFTKLKDKIPIMSQSNVVYSIPCKGCVNMQYIGTTKQLVKTRMNQHKHTVTKIQPERSALAAHAISNEHHFDLENPSVLFQCHHYSKRMFLEELCIKASNNCVNIKSKEAMNISNIYTRLLDTHNRRNN